MLAIVIPAYKPQFFRLALGSIAAQTNQNFKCYIFDDAAPDEIKSISNDFPMFQYTRFNENMGGHDLVEHWHRCLESIEEEWVWLFSDDDIMAPNCVEEFYKSLKQYSNATVFRFAVEQIDVNGAVVRSISVKNETSLEFLFSRWQPLAKGGTLSFMQDHIFNWKTLKKINGGFVKFPLAWCSDDATWCLLGKTHDIVAIPTAIVQWRMSGMNITSTEDKKTLEMKLYAWKLFYYWCSKNFKLPLSYKWKFARMSIRRSTRIPYKYYFQPPIFSSPAFLLIVLLIPIQKIYATLKSLVGSTSKAYRSLKLM